MPKLGESARARACAAMACISRFSGKKGKGLPMVSFMQFGRLPPKEASTGLIITETGRCCKVTEYMYMLKGVFYIFTVG